MLFPLQCPKDKKQKSIVTVCLKRKIGSTALGTRTRKKAVLSYETYRSNTPFLSKRESKIWRNRVLGTYGTHKAIAM